MKSLRQICDEYNAIHGPCVRGGTHGYLDEAEYKSIDILWNLLTEDPNMAQVLGLLGGHPEHCDHFAIVAGKLYFGNSDVEMYFKLVRNG